MRRASASLAILALLGGVRIARAEARSLPLELDWDAPDGCPDSTFVVARVEQILHGSRVAPTWVAARAKIERTNDGRFQLALSIRTADVEETRTIVGSTCPALAQATAVVVALAIDPSHDATPLEGEPPPPDPPSDATTPAVSARPSPPVASPATERPGSEPRKPAATARIALGAGGALVSGVLPDVGGGIGVSATLRVGHFRAGVLGTYWVRQSPTFERGAGASFDMLEGGAFGAYLFPLGPVSVGPSASAEATHVRVQGFGIRNPRASSSLWPTAGVGARLEARVASSFGLFARAEVALAIGAPTFTLSTAGDAVRLHEPGPIAPRANVGAEIVLP